MNQSSANVLTAVTSKTNSDLILFAVILAWVAIILYTFMSRDRKAARKQHNERFVV